MSVVPSKTAFIFFVKCLAISFLFVAVAVVVWRLADLAILLFGSIFISIGLRCGAVFIGKWARVGTVIGLIITVLIVIFGLVGALIFFGNVAADQFGELGRQIPKGLSVALDWLKQQPYGPYIITQAHSIAPADMTGAASRFATFIFQIATTIFGYAVLIFLVAIYLAAQPELYRNLLFRIVPPNFRLVTIKMCDRAGQVLLRWLLGQFVVMMAIWILSGLGLWALGIEAPVALGLVGGLLTFIPYFGAIIAAIPATLVALTQSPLEAVWVITMYAGVHFVEGNFITPLVQAEATSLPPVLSLLSTVAFSILFGFSAVLLATPLTLLMLIALDVFYIEYVLGETGVLTRFPDTGKAIAYGHK